MQIRLPQGGGSSFKSKSLISNCRNFTKYLDSAKIKTLNYFQTNRVLILKRRPRKILTSVNTQSKNGVAINRGHIDKNTYFNSTSF